MDIQPQPIPTLWGFDITPDGEHAVLIAQHFLGTSVFHVSYENLDGFIEAFQLQKQRCDDVKAGTNGQQRLAIPPKVVLGPDGQPIKVIPPSPEVQEQEAKLHAVPPQDDEDAGRRGD